MNDADKKEFDAIFELNQQSWDRLAKRRTYEWRVAFGLWGIIAGLIGLLFTSDLHEKWYVIIGLIALGGCISELHRRWLVGLNESISLDRQMAIHWEDKLQEITKTPFPTDLKNRLEKKKNDLDTFWHSWSVKYEWYATNIFILTAILVAAFRIWGVSSSGSDPGPAVGA